MTHNYTDERIYGERGPNNAWDQEPGFGCYRWLRTLEAGDAMKDYQAKFLQRDPVTGHLLNGRGW